MIKGTTRPSAAVRAGAFSETGAGSMRRIIKRALCALVALMGGLFMTAMAETSRTLAVDFDCREGVPLLKKYGLFNSGIVGMKQYARDAHLLDGLRTDSLRIDLFMGENKRPFARVVDGEAGALTYNFEDLDALVRLLDAHGVRPYWSWCYMPFPLQEDGNWRKGPSSLEDWEAMFRVFAEHYREAGLRVAYHEVYNEPDCNDVFYLGTMEDYTALYLRASKALRAGDPDAVIGGPSTAFIDVTGERAMHAFLKAVEAEGAPLDFFSYHSYGCERKQYVGRTRMARDILSQYVGFDTTELHLNEFNSLLQPFLADGPAEHAIGGATMLTAFQLLLEETDVTLAHWAQFMDTGIEPLGSVDPFGRAKAAYWAYWMYSQLPEQRVRVEGLPDPMDEGLHAAASMDEASCCVLVWNDGKAAERAKVALANLPADARSVEIYEMNDDIDPFWHTIAPVEIAPTRVLAREALGEALSIELPAGGFALYRFLRGGEAPEWAEVGRLVRKHYYFPERGKASYAFFDETDQTAYLGMNGEVSARAIVGVEWDGLPGALQVLTRHGGAYEAVDLNSCLGVRVDYAVGGEYVKSALFTFMPVNPRRDSAVPWGTGRAPDAIVEMPRLMTGKALLMLSANAPEGWDGRAIITFDMHSAGPTLWMELNLMSPQAQGA